MSVCLIMQGCTSNHTIENCVCAYAIPTASLSVDQYVPDDWELERVGLRT